MLHRQSRCRGFVLVMGLRDLPAQRTGRISIAGGLGYAKFKIIDIESKNAIEGEDESFGYQRKEDPVSSPLAG